MQKTIAPTIESIREAAAVIAGTVVRTPLTASPKLSAVSGADIFLKYENLQATGSFKERGAVNKLMSLSKEERDAGVVTMSAGNHGQALACHAARLGITATIIMPQSTPFVKVGNTEAWGAKVILSGETIAESRKKALELVEHEGLTLVHPYDDPLIISGQGTIGLELMEDKPELEYLIVPVGGGGLISGIAMAVKALNPDIKIIGVESTSYPSISSALAGKAAEFGGMTLADGIAVKKPGTHTLPIVKSLVDDIVLVDEEEIEEAIFVLSSQQNSVVEGAGAVGLAAILQNKDRFRNKATGIVLSGGNIDPRMLASIMVRGLERHEKIITLRLTIFDQPGTLGKISSMLGESGANILSISHRRIMLDVPARGSSLDVMIEIKDAAHGNMVIEKLRKAGYDIVRLEGTTASDFVTI